MKLIIIFALLLLPIGEFFEKKYGKINECVLLYLLIHSSLNSNVYFTKNTPPPVVQDLGYSSQAALF